MVRGSVLFRDVSGAYLPMPVIQFIQTVTVRRLECFGDLPDNGERLDHRYRALGDTRGQVSPSTSALISARPSLVSSTP